MAFGDLKMGDAGDAVRDLQAGLNEVGFSISVDGVFGPETKSAVITFQRARALAANGVAGSLTLISLAAAKDQGWQIAQSATGTTTETPPQPQAIAKQSSGYSGLVILVGLALAAWYFTKDRSSVPRRGFATHPTEMDPEDIEEEEEEEEDE